MAPPAEPRPSLRGFRESLRRRADWEGPRGEWGRWLVFFACLFAGPVLLPRLSPAIGNGFVLGVLAFWIWWSLPFIGWRRSALNFPLVLIVIAVNVMTWMAVTYRPAAP